MKLITSHCIKVCINEWVPLMISLPGKGNESKQIRKDPIDSIGKGNGIKGICLSYNAILQWAGKLLDFDGYN